MIEKIRAFVEKHWDMVSYLFFGVLTTVVNYLVYDENDLLKIKNYRLKEVKA